MTGHAPKSAAPLPVRPRLADHVRVRRYVAGSDEWVLLDDPIGGAMLRLPPEDWELLSGADGTRDVDGILLAATRTLAAPRAADLVAVLSTLHGASLLEDGVRSLRTGPEPAGPPPGDRPLDPLPAYTFDCDGRGRCCSQYVAILFAPLDAARARSLLPTVRDGGARPDRAFSPASGSRPGRHEVVTLVDGRCAYLDGELCAIHAAAGSQAKPLRCRLFPATLVDDGEVVRVSVMIECSCVLRSIGREDGYPLVPAGTSCAGQLEPGTPIARLGDTLPITADTTGSRSDVVAWSRAAATSFASAEGADPIAWLWGLAAAIDRVGMAGSTADATPRSPEPSELREWLDALAARALRGIEADAAYKSPSDRSRLLTRGVHAATESLLCDDATTSSLLARPAAHAGHERFYVRAVLHGHHLFQRPMPLTAALRDRAVRLLVARAMGMDDVASDAPEDVHAFPLAALETVLRGHGVAAYASDVASPGA